MIRRRIARALGGFAKRLDRPATAAQATSAAAGGAWPASFERWRAYLAIDPSAIIAPSASLTVFDPPPEPTPLLTIGPGCHVFSSFALLRRQSRIRIGRDCQLGASQFIAAERIEIGDDVIMAWGCTVIDTDNHALDWAHRRHDVARCRTDWIETGGANIARSHDWAPVAGGPIAIGAKSWIGFGSVVLKRVRIGEGAVIGAASVVTRDVADWTVAGGNPARALKPAPRADVGEARR